MFFREAYGTTGRFWSAAFLRRFRAREKLPKPREPSARTDSALLLRFLLVSAGGLKKLSRLCPKRPSCRYSFATALSDYLRFENRGLKRGPIEGSAPTAVRITDRKVTYRYSDGVTKTEDFKNLISSEKRPEFPG